MATTPETREELWIEHRLLEERINNLYQREQVLTSEIEVLIDRQRLVWSRIIKHDIHVTTSPKHVHETDAHQTTSPKFADDCN